MTRDYFLMPEEHPKTLTDVKSEEYQKWLSTVLNKYPQPEAGDIIFNSLLSLVGKIAQNKAEKNVNADELNNYFLLTIWNGCQRLKPEQIPTFHTWINFRLSYALKDFYRIHDPLDRQHRLALKEVTQRVEDLGGEATLEEAIGMALEVLPESYKWRIDVARFIGYAAISYNTPHAFLPTLSNGWSTLDTCVMELYDDNALLDGIIGDNLNEWMEQALTPDEKMCLMEAMEKGRKVTVPSIRKSIVQKLRTSPLRLQVNF